MDYRCLRRYLDFKKTIKKPLRERSFLLIISNIFQDILKHFVQFDC